MTVDLLDPSLHASGRAAAVYAALRRDDPVSWRGDYWAVARHADVVEVAGDPARFSSARGTGMRRVDPGLRSVHISDPPVHTEMRALLEASLGPAWLRALAGPLRDEARARIAAWRGTVDAVATLAEPLAFGALERLLGAELPGVMPVLHRFARHADPRYRNPGETPEQGFRDAEQALWRVLDELVADRRRAPRADVTSRLAAALAGDDLRYALRLVVQTAYQTTAVAIAAAVAIAVEHRDQLAALPLDHTARAADEVLRWSSPVIRFARHVVHDTTLAGVPLRSGQRVVMLFASANRDDRAFRDPDRIDLARAPNPHLAFGAGPHACLGAALARLQVGAVLDALRERDVALVEPPRAFLSSVTAGYDRVLVRVSA